MPWALFDLDDTLIDHDSFGRFTAHLLRRNPLRLGVAVLLAPVVAVLVCLPRRRVHAGALLLWAGTVGLRDRDLDRIVRDHLRRGSVRERLRPGGAAALAAHLGSGHEVAVVTGSAALLAVPLCREIDPRIRVVGSTLRRRLGGLVADRHCRGEHKVTMLSEAGIGAEVVAAYGDSVSDGPMLALAHTAVLVNLPESAVAELRTRSTGRVVCVQWPPITPRAGEVRGSRRSGSRRRS
ncbi:HAD-IB family phosphatase [Nocardiopsis sp. MG754419]|uniref:HAD-IB family phosphatase n=1 Tax=Nocardiopsis sp. MG754419 TaxID=2259865 RepID=UPI001BAD4920|nr:HAD-IB family phosphatase [Nocardiopsis sp. MG754419]MBR8744922.1 haloacid dehalogenase-like hydrolase [Nocardiopsis sp. MG754419]